MVSANFTIWVLKDSDYMDYHVFTKCNVKKCLGSIDQT